MSTNEELIAENEALKCQVNELKECIVMYFNGAWDDDHASNIADYTKITLAHTPDHCIESVRIKAMRELASIECPASGYVVTSEESRRQIIGWADFAKKCNDSE